MSINTGRFDKKNKPSPVWMRRGSRFKKVWNGAWRKSSPKQPIASLPCVCCPDGPTAHTRRESTGKSSHHARSKKSLQTSRVVQLSDVALPKLLVYAVVFPFFMHCGPAQRNPYLSNPKQSVCLVFLLAEYLLVMW